MKPRLKTNGLFVSLFVSVLTVSAAEVEVLGPGQAINGPDIPGLFQPTPREAVREPTSMIANLSLSTDQSLALCRENRLDDAVSALTSAYVSAGESLEFKSECYVAFTLAYGVRYLNETGKRREASILADRVLKMLSEVEGKTDPIDTSNRAAIERIRRYLSGEGHPVNDSEPETGATRDVASLKDNIHLSTAEDQVASLGEQIGSVENEGYEFNPRAFRLSVTFTSENTPSVIVEIDRAGSYQLEASEDLRIWRSIGSKVRAPGRYEVPITKSFSTSTFFRLVQGPTL